MASINDRLQSESIAHRLFLTRYELGIAEKILKVLNDADAELSARLLVALDDMPSGSFSISRLESLLGSVRQLSQQAASRYYKSLTDELLKFSGYESGYQMSLFDSLLPDVIKRRFPLRAITEQQVFAAATATPFQGRLLKEWADNLEGDRLARIANAVRTGWLVGDTNEQIVRKVRGTRANQYRDGALEASRRNASAIVRTAVAHTAAVARDEFADRNSNYIKGKKWLSTLDVRTTPQCQVRDSKQYTMDNKPVGHKIPWGEGPGKIHFCCRSTYTLVLKSWREMGIDIDEIPAGTRASMDGQVPADTTYLDWLKNQSVSRQNKVLGPTRAGLMRDGKLQPDKFFTETGNYLSLERLQETETKAFERAGLVPGFSLAEAKNIPEVERWMTGRVADEVHLPEGVSLASAKWVARSASDVIDKFGLEPVKWFGEREGVKSSAAGAYSYADGYVHISRWAFDQSEWDAIAKNSAGMDLSSLVKPELQLAAKNVMEVMKVAPQNLPYVAVPSVEGTVWHEMGHHLYYSRLNEVRELSAGAMGNNWWRAVSVYSSDSDAELFAEMVSLFMEDGDTSKISPEVKAWLKKNSRS